MTKEALPLLRYRTADIAAVDAAPCACGRTLARMGPVHGRRDDMLILRGVNATPRRSSTSCSGSTASRRTTS